MRISKSISIPVHQPPLSSLNSARPQSKRVNRSDIIAQNPRTPRTPKSVLNQITSRLKIEKPADVPPELAAQVVKSYILPMFEYDTRVKQDSQRNETFGHKRNFSTETGTVYSELKLSSKLSKNIKNLESELSMMNQRIKDNTQEKNKVIQDNQQLLMELMNSKSTNMFLNEENLRLQRELVGIKFSIGSISSQLSKYRNLYEEILQDKEKLSKQLQEEKAINDIRLL